MRFVLFCHAFTSCWNNGHAHFLRGIARELIALGHRMVVCEPDGGWSRRNALAEGDGREALREAENLVPGVSINRYLSESLDDKTLEMILDDAEVVLVHEWNEPQLIAAIGRQRRAFGFRLLFLDAHHRAVTQPAAIEALELGSYDAVLAFGESLREVYCRRGWGSRALTWHEAADTALFRPVSREPDCDLTWVGNWGDEERNRELREFLIEPVARLRLAARVHGVRYPESALATLEAAGISYAGWLPNHRVPEAFARARVTVHIPRRAYATELAGIPTIRVFEALACGIPLVCSPWSDEEELFPADAYLMAADGDGMTAALAALVCDAGYAAELSRKGLEAIYSRHTCRHRAKELLAIVRSLSAREMHSGDTGSSPGVEKAP